ncbi:MAG: DUF2341 domain-containing protein, partial [Nanoarchaeota archaeon]|nr:DUF2341 domain-containing protein [Nanoarchaeota archaeon]
MGSGGGGTYNIDASGGNGGGSVFINVSETLANYGSISADGGIGSMNGGISYTYAAGGGSGGSIYIITDKIEGSGTITANGGAGGNDNYDGGGGGGGRIALYYYDNLFTGDISVNGTWGYNYGNNGTVFRSEIPSEMQHYGDSAGKLINIYSNIALKSEYEVNHSVRINRTLSVLWNNDIIRWNDSASNTSTIALYNLTGLKSNAKYFFSSNNVRISISPQTTDSNGNLPIFNATLSTPSTLEVISNDTTYPIVTAIDPLSVSYNQSMQINFTYNVTSNTTIANCSLYIDDSIDQTNSSITKNINQTFSKTIGKGNHNWNIYCTDIYDRINYSNYGYINISATGPAINSNATVPSRTYYDTTAGALTTYIRINATDIDEDIVSVNFTLTAPNSTKVIDNANASSQSGEMWYSSTFALDQFGQWNYTAIVWDEDAFNDTVYGEIRFLQINASMNASTVQPNASITISGHINDSQWNDVSDKCVVISIDGVDMTECIDRGDGSDGELNVSSPETVVNNYTYLTGNEGVGNITLTVYDASAFSEGDEILIMQVQNSSGGKAGLFEIKEIDSIEGDYITLTSAIENSYYSGTFDSTSSTSTQIVRIPEYTNVTVNSGTSIVAKDWDGYSGGVVIFRSKGAVQIEGNINVSENGFRGGAYKSYPGGWSYGYRGEGYKGSRNSGTVTAVDSAGGAGDPGSSGHGNGAGGGGGGYADAGEDGQTSDDNGGADPPGDGGFGAGNANLTIIHFGGGGGTGGQHDTAGSTGPGGDGGGIVMIYSYNINGSGSILSYGGDAAASSGTYKGGSGGGAGGTIYLTASNINVTSINASGGFYTCGTQGCGFRGGEGSEGRIRLDYSTYSALSESGIGYNYTFNNSLTNSTGDYSYTFTAPSIGGVYTLKVNSTYNGEYGEETASLAVNANTAPIINSNSTVPSIVYYNSNTAGTSIYLTSDVTDEDSDLMSVNFTLINPSGTNVIDNVNATAHSDDVWNSTSYTINAYGQWNYSVTAIDSFSNTYTSNGTINFLQITESLNDSTVEPNVSVTVSGHINDSQWSDITNSDIHLYINDSLINLTSGWDTTWWNYSWRYRKNISIENVVSTTINDSIVFVNFSTVELISEGKMKSDCGDIRFVDSDNIEMEYTLETSTCNSSNTIFWVWGNFTGNANTTIYAYYGNSEASLKTDYSNPDDSLVLYYHFDNSSTYGENSSA